MMKKNTVIVDEAVPEETGRRFQSFLRKRGYGDLKILFIAQEHPGMPDKLIIHHLLKKQSIFLTSDRPLHNTVLSRGLTSYYVKKGNFIAKKLKGIHTQETRPLHKDELTLKDSYRLSEPEIRPYLLPESEKRLKTLRTKRRRIRNYFGGFDRLDLNAITVSWRAAPASSALIGVKFRISSNIGIKALDASEGYILEQVSPEWRGIVTVNHALILSIQLMLHSVKTCVYYDSPDIDPTAWVGRPDRDNPHVALFAELSRHFPHIDYTPSTKGRFIEGLRAKLEQLSKGESNEVLAGNMPDILHKLPELLKLHDEKTGSV